MTDDRIDAWERVALSFDSARSGIGSDLIRQWSSNLPAGGEVLDLGCGTGFPISSMLKDAGFKVFGVDASPTLMSIFRRRLSGAQTACESVQDSTFFSRSFDGVVAVGLMFLLSEDDQRRLIRKVGHVVKPGGRFLFSAPRQRCMWDDLQTGQRSLSLGEAEYGQLLADADLRLIQTYVDEGDNHYFDAVPWQPGAAAIE